MATVAFLALFSAGLVAGDASSYRVNAVCNVDQLMRWFNPNTGLWDNYWWQGANMLSAVNDLSYLDENVKNVYNSIWENTYKNAPLHKPVSKMKRDAGKLEKEYIGVTPQEAERRKAKRDDVGFISHFYDDEGWWALAWIGALDNTGRREYLDEAIAIWYDMHAAWNKPACGGLPWNKDEGSGPLAIQNEIYIQVGAGLANRVGDDQKNIYLDAAKEAWDWFQKVGLINSDNLINDGVDQETCKNRGDTVFTYNQGVILGGLVELYRATGDESYLDRASDIANAVTTPGSSMLDDDGILVDPCDRTKTCSGDGIMFKGVFPRNLKKLQAVRPSDQWKSFLETNAQSIWNKDLAIEDGGCKNGVFWGGPYTDADPAAQSSALDCLIAALAATL